MNITLGSGKRMVGRMNITFSWYKARKMDEKHWEPYRNPIVHQEWGGGKVVGFNRLEELWKSEKCISIPIEEEVRKDV